MYAAWEELCGEQIGDLGAHRLRDVRFLFARRAPDVPRRGRRAEIGGMVPCFAPQIAKTVIRCADRAIVNAKIGAS